MATRLRSSTKPRKRRQTPLSSTRLTHKETQPAHLNLKGFPLLGIKLMEIKMGTDLRQLENCPLTSRRGSQKRTITIVATLMVKSNKSLEIKLAQCSLQLLTRTEDANLSSQSREQMQRTWKSLLSFQSVETTTKIIFSSPQWCSICRVVRTPQTHNSLATILKKARKSTRIFSQSLLIKQSMEVRAPTLAYSPKTCI